MKIPELRKKDFAAAITRAQRKRLMEGQICGGADISSLRKFLRMTQADLAAALGISLHTLRNWEQGHRTPDGPALSLLRIAARHPKILRENLKHRSRAA